MARDDHATVLAYSVFWKADMLLIPLAIQLFCFFMPITGPWRTSHWPNCGHMRPLGFFTLPDSSGSTVHDAVLVQERNVLGLWPGHNHRRDGFEARTVTSIRPES